MPMQRLTAEQITTAALDLMDSEGLAAVSMRALAQRLGVGTMTLYGYYRSRDELLDAVVDAATTDAASRRDPGRTGTDPAAELTGLFTALHRTLSEHPALYRIRMVRPFLSPGVLRVCDRALGQLRQAGLDDAAAVRGYRTLYLFTLGCVTYAEQDAADTRTALGALPSGDFPHLSALAPTMAETAGNPDEFPTGLATLLTAILGPTG
jgi:AcrR family transcriptional regulator